MGHIIADQTFTQAPSGEIKSYGYSTARRLENFSYQHLRGKKVYVTNESSANESLEKFYLDTIYAGTPVKFYPSTADDAIFRTMRIDARKGFTPEPMQSGWVGATGLFSIDWPMWQDV